MSTKNTIITKFNFQPIETNQKTMVNAIATSPKYQEFEAKHNRHLNMLAENVSLSLRSDANWSYRNDLLTNLFDMIVF